MGAGRKAGLGVNMRVTAYKCDVCGRLSEVPLRFPYEDYYAFEISPSRYGEHKGACSIECITKAVSDWRQNTDKEAEKTSEEIAAPVIAPAPEKEDQSASLF